MPVSRRNSVQISKITPPLLVEHPGPSTRRILLHNVQSRPKGPQIVRGRRRLNYFASLPRKSAMRLSYNSSAGLRLHHVRLLDARKKAPDRSVCASSQRSAISPDASSCSARLRRPPCEEYALRELPRSGTSVSRVYCPGFACNPRWPFPPQPSTDP